MAKIKHQKYQAYTSANLDSIPQLKALNPRHRMAIKAVASVLPFKVNRYVVDHLIDWSEIPDDSMFQLCFPQEGMLDKKDFDQIYNLINQGINGPVLSEAVHDIRFRLNPHPAGQKELNVPYLEGQAQAGMQHKYRETVLFFPSQGQTCHTYCTYCFRWAQFVGIQDLRFATNESDSLVRYLKKHPEVQDVIFTGGDPMIMKSEILAHYIKPLLKVPTLKTIRIGTKSVAWWPYRFVTEPDADDLLNLFETVVKSGKHLALMAHYSHPRELSTPVSEEAVRRINQTGAVVRCQSPLIRHVNDNASLWAELWQKQVSLGAIPYYMFMERDTGAKQYFEVPIVRAIEIFNKAYEQVSGLGRTVRGPSMSCTPGKVMVDGITKINGQKVIALKFIQARDPDWVNQVFFAKYDRKASWLDDLKPAFGQKFFFDDQMNSIKEGKHKPLWKNQEVKTKPAVPTADPSYTQR